MESQTTQEMCTVISLYWKDTTSNGDISVGQKFGLHSIVDGY